MTNRSLHLRVSRPDPSASVLATGLVDHYRNKTCYSMGFLVLVFKWLYAAKLGRRVRIRVVC